MDPHMDHGYGKKRVEAGGETLLPHDQAPVVPLAPGTRPLNLVARRVLVDRASAQLFGLPPASGNLGSDTTCVEATTEVFGIIPLRTVEEPRQERHFAATDSRLTSSAATEW
jgi:hypothetical protein